MALPTAFGPYFLFDQIGRGGMADIYLARARVELGGERLAVVKRILPALARNDAFSRMMIAEAKLAAQLRHANVVQVFDLGREGDTLYIAMEYVEGFDLHQLLTAVSKRRVPMPAEFLFRVVLETLRALDYAHRARGTEGQPLGIVHRDVSPSNILISLEGEVKLCDFGIARALTDVRYDREESSDVTPLPVVGKGAYMAPEHARGELVDARADVFAAGIVLYELCAGRRLYKGSDEEVLELARRAAIPELPDRGLPDHARLSRIVRRALEVDPALRYPTAAAFRADLESYVIDARLMASPLRFGAFLSEHFDEDLVRRRRARERAARALAKGPPVVLTVVTDPRKSEVPEPEEQSTELARAPSVALSSSEPEGAPERRRLWFIVGLAMGLGAALTYLAFLG